MQRKCLVCLKNQTNVGITDPFSKGENLGVECLSNSPWLLQVNLQGPKYFLNFFLDIFQYASL